MEKEKHQVLLANISKIEYKTLNLFLSIFFFIINYVFNDIFILKIFSTFLILLILFLLYIKVGFLHPIATIFGLFCFFNYNRVIFDILGLMRFESGNFFDGNNSPIESQVISLKIINYSLIAWYLGIIQELKSKYNFIKKEKNLYKISNFLFKITIIISLFFLFKEVKEILKNGYMSIYLNENSRNIFEKIILNSPFILYCINLSTGYHRKIFFENTFLILIFIFLDILKGGRGLALSYFLTISIYYYFIIKNNTKISIIKIVLLTFFLSLVSIMIGNFRSDLNLLNKKIFQDIVEFFTSQTITCSLLTKSIEYKELLINKISIFVPWSKEIFFYNISETKSFNTIISMTLNKEMFQNGFGLGGNPLAELYIFLSNEIIFFLIFLIYIFFILKYINWCNKSWFTLCIFLYFLPKLLLMPRSNFIFINILDILKFILIILFVIFLNFMSKLGEKDDKSKCDNTCL